MPSAPVRAFVSHYWLGLENRDPVYSLLPDGAVDVVISCREGRTHSAVYGTATLRAEVALETGRHYLGIRFLPGQSRHFLGALSRELTDRCEPGGGLLRFSLDGVDGNLDSADVFTRLDALLERHLLRHCPRRGRIDPAIALLDAAPATPVAAAAAVFGGSRRQFERVFLDTVGVAAKTFAGIRRFRHALDLLGCSTPLAVTAVVAGYADQSHMNRAFRRFAGMSPRSYINRHVAFVQDGHPAEPENSRLR